MCIPRRPSCDFCQTSAAQIVPLGTIAHVHRTLRAETDDRQTDVPPTLNSRRASLNDSVVSFSLDGTVPLNSFGITMAAFLNALWFPNHRVLSSPPCPRDVVPLVARVPLHTRRSRPRLAWCVLVAAVTHGHWWRRAGSAATGSVHAFGASLPLSSVPSGRRGVCSAPRGTTRLPSLQPLVQAIVEASNARTSQSEPMLPPQQQTIFVGGKGGVGKTSVSAALAWHLATTAASPSTSGTTASPWNGLLVSTDPAHSLSDALDVDLRSAQGRPVRLESWDSHRSSPSGGSSGWYAQEVDAVAALEEFRTLAATALNVPQLAATLSVSPEWLESLGVAELSSLLDNPPPGLDELVALSNIFDTTTAAAATSSSTIPPRWDVVIVDTAPTGHTLRLLALQQFLNGLLGKLIQLRLKLTGLASTLQAFLGGSATHQQQQVV